MKRPNLVNPQNWSPFKSIPIVTPEPIQPQLPIIPEPIEVFRPMTKRDLIQRNSFFINTMCFIFIVAICYFLYSIYLERKIFSEYLDYIKKSQEEYYPGFL